ncbi:MAG: sulfurtransferase [Bacteroidetes bacterium]|nr:MAG: sulfurtransferase [Bacteroidota bacterium]
MFTTLISAPELATHYDPTNWRIVECSFDLNDPQAGRKLYAAGHIPGAQYAHLDEDLSGNIIPGQTGRHPLPSVAAMVDLFERLGISNDSQVVVYCNKHGAIAARLWWMLRYLGHKTVAVLDGGRNAWIGAAYAWTKDVPTFSRGNFTPRVQTDWLVDADEVDRIRQQPDYALVDSRTPERYRGDQEPIDPVAGHIPGAINMPFPENWDPTGHLRSPAELQERFAALPPPERSVFYCGSGVTACHNLLAYAHAGLGNARLYAGSWSEWITDSRRAVG